MNVFCCAVLVIASVFVNLPAFSECRTLGTIEKTADSIGQILTDVESSELDKDGGFTFCNRNMGARYLATKSFDQEQIDKMTDAQVEKKSFELAKQEGLAGWPMALIPSAEAKRITARTAIVLPNSDGIMYSNSLGLKETLNEAKQVLTSPDGFYPEDPGQDLVKLSLEKGDNPLEGSFLAHLTGPIELAGGAYLCRELTSVASVPSCAGSVKRMIGGMEQRGIPPIISLPGLANDVINSKKYDGGLRIAAQKIIQNFESPASSDGDLKSDIKSSFMQAGMDADKAEDATWNVLGLLSTGGANLSSRLTKIHIASDRWPTVTALSVIAALLPSIDFKYAAKGKLYSYPLGISGSCDTSKSYHFWMAAYLARKEALRTGNGSAAAAAAYSVEKAYQVVGNITNRYPGAVLFKYHSTSPAVNIVRADLAYSAAGALYGAGSAKGEKPKINVDHGISVSIKNGKILRPLDEQQVESQATIWQGYGYSRWSQIFAPDSVYEEFQRSAAGH